MKKVFKRALPVLLSACMAAGMLLPAAAANQGSGETREATGSYDKSIVMVDAGRKYFSVDSLKSIMDSASSAGMHYLMLGLGNDGLRFLLDDMTLTVGDTTYTSEEVSTAIHTGNEAYSDFEVDELTEADMDQLFTYAGSKGMEIIPLVNTPGHMDAILDAAEALTGTKCAYGSSQRTIDVTNETATDFTQALLQKYITYFAGKGCTLFNMGCDEFANDDPSVGMGFNYLVDNGQYGSFVTYVNEVAGMVKEAGMTPMAFNDGIYYDSNTSFGTFDQDIIICYWSSGWWGYDVAKPAFLAQQGHKLVNTHGDWYWIVGGNKCSVDKASQFDINTFMGGTVDDPVGAMFCIWSDYPQAETDMSVAQQVADVIAAFGATLPETPVRDSHAVTQPSDVNTTLLQKTYDYALTCSTEGVTDTAKAAFEKALANAEKVLANPTSQEEVNAAWDALLEGIWGLGLVQGDKAELNQLIAKAESMDESKYVSTYWPQLVEALEAARKVAASGDAMNDTIKPAAQALLNAILAQRFKADKSILEDLIGKAENMDLTGYTAQSVAAFRSALAAAQTVMADATLSVDDQKTVDNAVAALSAAMDGLTAGGAPETTDTPQASQAPETSAKPESTDKPAATTQPQATQKPQNTVPQTGDSAQVMVYVVALAAAVCLLTGATVVARKRRG